MLLVSLLLTIVFLFKGCDVVFVLLDVCFSQLSVFIDPEELFQLLQLLLNNKEFKEFDQVSYDKIELRSVSSIDLSFSPEIE